MWVGNVGNASLLSYGDNVPWGACMKGPSFVCCRGGNAMRQHITGETDLRDIINEREDASGNGGWPRDYGECDLDWSYYGG